MLFESNIRKKIGNWSLIFFSSCLSFSPVETNAHPAIDLIYSFFEPVPKDSDFSKYMQSPLRQKLSSHENTATEDPNANDASNWSGCQTGKGVLAGTFRDISACAVSACYGRDVTVAEMKNLSYFEAEKVINWIWDKIQASKIPNQSVANLVMHIQMQYGNIKIVQLALNEMGAKLRLSGRMDSKTQEALLNFTRLDRADTFNQIRKQLIHAYDRMRGTSIYVRIINKEFPPMISIRGLYREAMYNFELNANYILGLILPRAATLVSAIRHLG